MRRSLILLVIACLILSVSSPAFAAPQQERRVALVIGNGAYKAGPLKNPANDARDMAATLKSLGFEVILRENAGLRQMNEAIDQFWGSLKKGGVGLFFFAGHGLQVGGENFLVPVDARIALEKDVQYECVNAGKVLGRMEDAGNGLNIVILDACRNNPFARSFRTDSRGLAKMDAPTGSLLAFATAPGDVAADGEGKNGLYTSHLLRHLRTPGLKVEDVLKQVRIGVAGDSAKLGKKQTPWESSSLMGDFYFAQGGKVASLEPPPSFAPPAVASAKFQPAEPVVQALDLVDSLAGEFRLAGHSITVALRVRFKREGARLAGTATGTNGPFDFDTTVRDVQLKEGQLQFVVVQKGGVFPDILYRFTVSASPGVDELPILKTEKRFSATGVYAVSQEFPNAHLIREGPPPAQPQQVQPPASAGPQAGAAWRDPVTGMEFVWVPPGCFQMGSPPAEDGRSPDEGPVHEVCLAGFWMGKYAVTNAEFRRFAPKHESAEFRGQSLNGDLQPVVNVSWEDVSAYLQWLSAKGNGTFRLPTEAQWEYAARAGTTTSRHWGDNPDDACNYANTYDLSAVKFQVHDAAIQNSILAQRGRPFRPLNCFDGYIVTAPRGGFKPNAFGLYDMQGNVWQWCDGRYDPNAYADPAAVALSSVGDWVLRGGDWQSDTMNVRSAKRHHHPVTPEYRNLNYGFRLVRLP
jgi:formylglycine-generating enzyme required for sulfatase activity